MTKGTPLKKIAYFLKSGIIGRGFQLQPGNGQGEIDDAGVVWIQAPSSGRTPGQAKPRLVGIHAARFEYVEAPESAAAIPDTRADINRQLKAAAAIRESREHGKS